MTFFWILFAIATVWLATLAWCDCRTRQLPNMLTLPPVLILPLFYWITLWIKTDVWTGFRTGFLMSIAGAAIGGIFLLVPYLLRGAGAGDVKMLTACGALAGFPGVVMMLIFTSIAGLILGLVMIIWGKTDPARLKHALRCAFDPSYDRAQGKAALPDKKNEKVRIPYGVAIAAGTWICLLVTAVQIQTAA